MDKKLILVDILNKTAKNLESHDAKYQWGHMGQCNVGHLVQAITGMKDLEIVKSIDHDMNEWSEHAQVYCSQTGHKIDDLFRTMETYGFHAKDVIHLENLSDKRVLENLPGGFKYLQKNNKDHVVSYMRSLADMILKAA